jgi:nucleoside-diphosphate-sugar epimerase
MTSDRAILITGVTGNQGGTVAQALRGTGFHLRGLTRKPDSERAAAALARHDIELVKGDLDDETSLRHALAGAWVMLEWFDRVGYSADIAGLEREFGRPLTKLPDWARRHARPYEQTQGALA